MGRSYLEELSDGGLKKFELCQKYLLRSFVIKKNIKYILGFAAEYCDFDRKWFEIIVR